MRKTIIFTGGGSGGHVMPAVTLIKFLNDHYEIEYIGSQNGVERDLIGQLKIPYSPIYTGKLRRYFSLQNFTDIFRLGLGFLQSLTRIAKSPKDSIIFSTGGFVSVPVVIAAWILKRDIYIHEQTSCVGLANKIASKFAKKVFLSFESSKKFFPEHKAICVGYPLREEFFDKELRHYRPNTDAKPLLFVTGGGNGSELLNKKVLESLDDLKERFHIIHQVGKNFVDKYKEYESEDYRVYSFVGPELIDYFKVAEVVLCRAGAGTVCELMALGKPAIFIPLKIAQKNEQFHNAMESKERFGSFVVTEDEFEQKALAALVSEFKEKFPKIEMSPTETNATQAIIKELSS